MWFWAARNPPKTLHHIATNRITSHCIATHSNALRHIALHCIASHSIASYHIASHHIGSYCIASQFLDQISGISRSYVGLELQLIRSFCWKPVAVGFWWVPTIFFWNGIYKPAIFYHFQLPVLPGGRHLVDKRGDFSWTHLVTFRGHFCPREVLFLGDISWTFFGWHFVDNFWVNSFEHSSNPA